MSSLTSAAPGGGQYHDGAAGGGCVSFGENEVEISEVLVGFFHRFLDMLNIYWFSLSCGSF